MQLLVLEKITLGGRFKTRGIAPREGLAPADGGRWILVDALLGVDLAEVDTQTDHKFVFVAALPVGLLLEGRQQTLRCIENQHEDVDLVLFAGKGIDELEGALRLVRESHPFW